MTWKLMSLWLVRERNYREAGNRFGAVVRAMTAEDAIMLAAEGDPAEAEAYEAVPLVAEGEPAVILTHLDWD